MDKVHVLHVSGHVLVELAKSHTSASHNDIWYTYELQLQIATFLPMERCRVTITDRTGNVITDKHCIVEREPLTVILALELRSKVFQGS